jgi:hypothetical protein
MTYSRYGQVGLSYEDAEVAALCRGRDWMLGYTLRSQSRVGQWDSTINLPEARVLHATVDEAHTFGGYIRYTTDSRPVSETHGLGIMTYKDGRWASSGGVGVMMYHDYTNDLPENGT